MAIRDFKKLPDASEPGQATDIGKRNQDIDKYLSDQIEKPEIINPITRKRRSLVS